MNESRKPGRPKKHLEESHHFHSASDLAEEPVVEVSENPTEPLSSLIVEESTIVEQVNTFTESPIEEKIHELVEAAQEGLNGWCILDSDTLINQPPRNGMPIWLSENPKDGGILFFWKRTRAFNGKRYEETGKWVDFQTGMNISFTPRYWKERF